MEFDFVITVCDHAKERCTVLPGKAQQFHYNFPDPAKATGTPAEIDERFRYTRDLIKNYCREFADQYL
ncbi:hypothetical protein MKP07_21465 [Niabella hibiscisoli]|nr:hypothetical protein [Niabella hibiscisoli]